MVYELAYELRIPIYKLADEMTYEELLGWFAYFEKRPVGWREDDRAMKYLQTQGVKEKPWTIFPSLNPIYNARNNLPEGQIAANNLKGSTFFNKMLAAKGGEKITDLFSTG